MCSHETSWAILGLRRFRFLYRYSCLSTIGGSLNHEGRRGARIRRLRIAGTGRARIRRQTMPARGRRTIQGRCWITLGRRPITRGRCRVTQDRHRITQTRAITGLSSNYLPANNYLLPSNYLPLSYVPTFRPFRRPTGRSLTRETRGLLVMYCRNTWSRRRSFRLG
jgi:hypothetical protein